MHEQSNRGFAFKPEAAIKSLGRPGDEASNDLHAVASSKGRPGDEASNDSHAVASSKGRPGDEANNDSHAVASSKVPMDELLACQVVHSFGYLDAHIHQLLLRLNNLHRMIEYITATANLHQHRMNLYSLKLPSGGVPFVHAYMPHS